MNQKGFANIILILVLVALVGSGVYFILTKQISSHVPTTTTSISATDDTFPNYDKRLKLFDCKDLSQLSVVDQRLVEESKLEIIKAGISASYFEQHFCPIVIEVIPPTTRILWKYSVNNYEMIFEDSFASGSHYILQNIKPLHDVVKTISQKKAKQLIESCTGPKIEDSFLFAYQPLSDLGSRFHVIANSKGIPITGRGGAQLIKTAKIDLENGKVFCEGSEVGTGPR